MLDTGVGKVSKVTCWNGESRAGTSRNKVMTDWVLGVYRCCTGVFSEHTQQVPNARF